MKLFTAKNDIKGNFIGACGSNGLQYDPNVDPAKRHPRDTIDGLTVGCGQNIVYGWTVQKCNANFDYVFVMDTSTSMMRTRDVSSGNKLKKDAANEELQDFLTNIKNSGGDHRAALIQFNHRSDTRVVTPLTNNIDTVKQAATSGLTYKEGTCIECGLQTTLTFLQNERQDKSRRVVVVFLTDGLPNSDPGAPKAGGYEGDIAAVAGRLKALNTAATGNVPPTVIGIGYGDPNFSGAPQPGDLVNAELIRVIKLFTTDDTWAFSTAANVSITEVFNRIQQSLNSCALNEKLHAAFVKSKDVNNDGIINTVDLFALYDAYFQKGTNLAGDLNQDGIINSLDISLLIGDLGTVVEPGTEQ
ncbi:MAG: von Willebrand factor type A domain protein [Microgenomates bacterium OLB23]|nr:MAG: von Willebrand factor type A domain protein [Microgenomates bacterium OLB23]